MTAIIAMAKLQETVEIGKEIVTEIEIDEIGVTGITRETIMTEKIVTEIARGTETVGIEIETETETGVTEIEIINTNLRNIRQIARKIENIAGGQGVEAGNVGIDGVT